MLREVTLNIIGFLMLFGPTALILWCLHICGKTKKKPDPRDYL